MNQLSTLTAEKLLNTYDEEQIADMLYQYGELRQSRRIASAIVHQRRETPIRTIAELVAIVRPFCTKGKENKEMAPIFQAIRIEVNAELEALKTLLRHSSEMLNTGGRIAVISYHSLEDRLVKNYFKTGNFNGVLQKDFYGNLIAPLKSISKAITSTTEELNLNPRARSAKLRVAERI